MEELYELSSFFPLSIDDPKLREYIDHHISHLQKCCENGLYSSGYPHLHILYMAFVYFQLLRIANEKKEEFKYCWIGLPSQEKDFLKNPTHPFSFSPIPEKSVFRFFRLVDFDDGTIANISALVKDRNNNLHASGEIACATDVQFAKQLNEYTSKMSSIVEKQRDFLNDIYQKTVATFDEDYEMTNDDVLLSFGSFSEFELKILTTNKSDKISGYILSSYLEVNDE